MSYDLRIYTIKKQEFTGLSKLANIEISEEGFTIPLKNRQVIITKETPIEDEDIPLQICKELPGLKYLIECSLEPITSNEKYIKELMKLAKIIANEGIGVIENPQTDEIILPSGVKRVQKAEKTERYSIIQLSWWFNHDSLFESNNLKLLLEAIEKYLPEALPRRFGEYEPPKEIFTDISSFHDYLYENVKKSIVWYPSKPVDYVHLGIPDYIGPARLGYRFGYFTIAIDASVLTMPGWTTTIERLFRNISLILAPFYGDIYILRNQIRSHTSSFETERHPIVSWWWNGIPRKLGIGLVIGEPLLAHVQIGKPACTLDNGCKMIFCKQLSEIQPIDIEIKDEIMQPELKEKQTPGTISYGFKGCYPKFWPFSGPKVND